LTKATFIMTKLEFSLDIAAPADTIYAIYADVANWPTWDAELKSSQINGPFQSGTPGTIAPKSGPKSNVIFTNVRRNETFSVECPMPLCKMTFGHTLSPTAGGTRVTHDVTFEGLLAPLWSRLIGSGMKKSTPVAMAALKRAAEAKA
jgi:hypothetical protein